MTPHLTEIQLYELVSATCENGAAPAQEHLDNCARCRQELAQFEQSLANFRLAASNFALLGTPARPAVGKTVPRGFFAVPRLILGSGLASVLAVAVLAVSTLHKQPEPIAARPVAAAAPQPVSDEALLRDIDSDLSTSVPPSLQPLDTVPAASEPTATSTSN